MSNLKKGAQKVGNLVRGRGYQTRDALNRQRALEGEQAAKRELFQSPSQPDPDEQRRLARRRQTRRRGSRVSNVLTQQSDTLGPGAA